MGWVKRIPVHECNLPIVWDTFTRKHTVQFGSMWECDACKRVWTLKNGWLGLTAKWTTNGKPAQEEEEDE